MEGDSAGVCVKVGEKGSIAGMCLPTGSAAGASVVSVNRGSGNVDPDVMETAWRKGSAAAIGAGAGASSVTAGVGAATIAVVATTSSADSTTASGLGGFAVTVVVNFSGSGWDFGSVGA